MPSLRVQNTQVTSARPQPVLVSREISESSSKLTRATRSFQGKLSLFRVNFYVFELRKSARQRAEARCSEQSRSTLASPWAQCLLSWLEHIARKSSITLAMFFLLLSVATAWTIPLPSTRLVAQQSRLWHRRSIMVNSRAICRGRY